MRNNKATSLSGRSVTSIIVGLIMITSGPALVHAESAPTAPAESALPWHAPIVIRSDADYENPPAVSGVVSGSGTENDPYVIEGWAFAVPRLPGPFSVARGAIHIENASAHVVIRGNTFDATRSFAVPGDSLRGGPLEPESVTIPGIAVVSSAHIRIEGNTFTQVGGSQGTIHVTDQVLGAANTARTASLDIVVHANVISAAPAPAILTKGSEIAITDNDISTGGSKWFPGAVFLVDGIVGAFEISRNTLTYRAQQGTHEITSTWRPLMLYATNNAVGSLADLVIRSNLVNGYLGIEMSVQAQLVRIENNQFSSPEMWGKAVSVHSYAYLLLKENRFDGFKECLSTNFGSAIGNSFGDCAMPPSSLSRTFRIGEENTLRGAPMLDLRGLSGATLDLSGTDYGWFRMLETVDTEVTNLRTIEGADAFIKNARDLRLGSIDIGGDAWFISADFAIDHGSVAGMIRASASRDIAIRDVRAKTLYVSGDRASTDVVIADSRFDKDVDVVARDLSLSNVSLSSSIFNVGGNLAVERVDASRPTYVHLSGVGAAHVTNSSFAAIGPGLVIVSRDRCTDFVIERSAFASSWANVVVASCGLVTARNNEFLGSTAIVNEEGKSSPGGHVDARENWWGAASGPRAAGNPDGEGGEIRGDVAYDPWLVTEPQA